jgi:hypothetical protein
MTLAAMFLLYEEWKNIFQVREIVNFFREIIRLFMFKTGIKINIHELKI